MLEIVVVLVLAAVSYKLWTSLEVSIDHRPDRTTIAIWRDSIRNSGGQGSGEAGRPRMSGGWGPPPPTTAGGWPCPQRPTASTTAEDGSPRHPAQDRSYSVRRMDELDATVGATASWLQQMDDNEDQGGHQGLQLIPTKAPPPSFKHPPAIHVSPPHTPVWPLPEFSRWIFCHRDGLNWVVASSDRECRAKTKTSHPICPSKDFAVYMWLWLALWWTIANSAWLVKTFGGPPLPISACQSNA